MNKFEQNILTEIGGDVAIKGWSHLHTDIDPTDLSSVNELFADLSSHLGVDESIGPEISVISPRSETANLATSTNHMSFHTDNVYLEKPCKYIALFCAVQAESGGSNELVDGIAIAKTLPPEVRSMLKNQHWKWDNPVTKQPSKLFSVLNDSEEQLRWWRMSLLNKELGALAIADLFENALNNSTNRHEIKMTPGDILATDNSRILHNRNSFKGARRVYRARFW